MYIVTVIPIKKGFLKENLTYFSSIDIPLGHIVSVPIKSKEVNAIVVDIEKAINLKSDIKNADYQIKKIIKVKGKSPFSLEFFEACKKIKDYYISNTGTIIRNLIPIHFFENIDILKKIKEEEKEIDREDILQEKLIFQSSKEDRMAFYKTLIRESFAKKESVYICLPTRYDIEIFKRELSKGIENYVFTFHSETPKKNLIKNYNDSILEEHPVLIIGTGSFLFIHREDIKTIILESESSEFYKQLSRPYLNIRSFVEVLSSMRKIKLIFGDTILRPETLYRHETGEFGEISPPSFRLSILENQIIIDMKEEDKKQKELPIISEKTKEIIDIALSKNESVFLFSLRKGLAPLTTCNDCGNTLLCPFCQTPIVLYGPKQSTANKVTTSRIFMCNKCGHKEKTEVRCPNCNSWNLTPLGIGADRVYEEVKNLYPKTKIIQIDKESILGEKDLKEKIDLFNQNKGSILIGTEIIFYYLHSKVSNSVIVSMDGLLSIPNFNITQRILQIVEKLNNLTENKLIIQTRMIDNNIFKNIITGNILPLYREDLMERNTYGYPPFKRLIKITFSGNKIESEKAREYLEHLLKDYDPQIFSAFIGKIKGNYITNTVIKVKLKDWEIPNKQNYNISQELKRCLYELPPSFSINIDPEDLL